MDIIDYALPMQKAHEALKEMHLAMLARDHEQALDRALDAMVEVRMAYNAIRHDQEMKVR